MSSREIYLGVSLGAFFAYTAGEYMSFEPVTAAFGVMLAALIGSMLHEVIEA